MDTWVEDNEVRMPRALTFAFGKVFAGWYSADHVRDFVERFFCKMKGM